MIIFRIFSFLGGGVMWVKWYRRGVLIVLVAFMLLGGSYCFLEWKQGQFEQEVSTSEIDENLVIPGGMPVGLYLETDGVMVLGTEAVEDADGIAKEPARHLVKPGDYIVGVDEKEIGTKKELQAAVAREEASEVVLHLRREEEYLDVKTELVDSEEGKKLGIWVKDNEQGLGTITFLDSQSHFGALGHGIRDTDTNGLLEIGDGRLYTTSIQDIQKGKAGDPGGMEGVIVYNNYNILGSIDQNTEEGIYGTIDRIDALFSVQEPVPAAAKKEVHTGDAVIRCAVSGEVEDYRIRITKIDWNAREANKAFVIEVTDEKLLGLTGGIVQGMSGSPILQDGKLVGAVTHVFVQNAARGYGIYIGNMLNHVR